MFIPSETLTTARRAAGLSIRDLAELADRSVSTVSRIEAGAADPEGSPVAYPPLNLPSGSASEIDWGTVFAVAVPIMLLLIWIGRRRFRIPRPAAATPGPARSLKAAPAASSAAAKPKFCAQCGAPIGANARFCGGCGAPLRS